MMKWKRLKRNHFLVKGSKAARNKCGTTTDIEFFINVGAMKLNGPLADK
ncbi:hypothetical protein ALT721_2520030 [Alteromonas alvinellae]